MDFAHAFQSASQAIFDGASVEEQLGVLEVVRGMVAEGVVQRLPTAAQTKVADALLTRLRDVDVSVRNLAARILARLDPALSVSRVFHLCCFLRRKR